MNRTEALLDAELERTGWKAAHRHFENACAAVLAHDDAAYKREMSAFRRISKTWESREREAGQRSPEQSK